MPPAHLDPHHLQELREVDRSGAIFVHHINQVLREDIKGVASVGAEDWLLIVELDLQFRLSRVEPDEAQGLAELPVGHHSVTVAVKPEQKLRVKMQFSGNVSY